MSFLWVSFLRRRLFVAWLIWAKWPQKSNPPPPKPRGWGTQGYSAVGFVVCWRNKRRRLIPLVPTYPAWTQLFLLVFKGIWHPLATITSSSPGWALCAPCTSKYIINTNKCKSLTSLLCILVLDASNFLPKLADHLANHLVLALLFIKKILITQYAEHKALSHHPPDNGNQW